MLDVLPSSHDSATTVLRSLVRATHCFEPLAQLPSSLAAKYVPSSTPAQDQPAEPLYAAHASAAALAPPAAENAAATTTAATATDRARAARERFAVPSTCSAPFECGRGRPRSVPQVEEGLPGRDTRVSAAASRDTPVSAVRARRALGGSALGRR